MPRISAKPKKEKLEKTPSKPEDFRISDLVRRVRAATERGTATTEGDREQIVRATVVEIAGAIKKGKRVCLPGLGTFEPRLVKGRTLRAAMRGSEQKFEIPPHYRVRFRPSADVKEAVKQKPVEGR